MARLYYSVYLHLKNNNQNSVKSCIKYILQLQHWLYWCVSWTVIEKWAQTAIMQVQKQTRFSTTQSLPTETCPRRQARPAFYFLTGGRGILERWNNGLILREYNLTSYLKFSINDIIPIKSCAACCNIWNNSPHPSFFFLG